MVKIYSHKSNDWSNTPMIYSICHEIWNQTFQGGILLHMKIYDQCRLQSHAHKTKSISYHKN